LKTIRTFFDTFITAAVQS